MMVVVMPLVNAQGLGNCNLGEYPLGECIITTSKLGGGGGGGGSVNVPPTFTEVSLFGEQPDFINDTLSCKEGYQLFDGKCYSCNPEIGYLEFNPSDRSVVCITCNEEYFLNENRTCSPKKKVSPFTIFHKATVDIGKSILPNNPTLGASLMIIFSLVIFGLAIQNIINKDKEKVRKDLEKSEEENE